VPPWATAWMWCTSGCVRVSPQASHLSCARTWSLARVSSGTWMRRQYMCSSTRAFMRAGIASPW
jgi:hypothetical protein